MRNFRDDRGRAWTASAREEDTPRHHGRWVLVFHPADDLAALIPLPEVRWQTAQSAERTLRTMAEFELVRRLLSARARAGAQAPRSAAAASGSAAATSRSA
ncbi:MAG TPA: hypothetical protein VMN78_07045 [Longimicrobiales bacterium]|nr:hypothetical protein [Longimicrobiales bacterium]